MDSGCPYGKLLQGLAAQGGKQAGGEYMFFGRDDKKDAQKRGSTIPLLPLRDIIVFPHMVVPLFVGREKSIAALKDAMNNDKEILLAAQKLAKTNEPMPED